MDAKLLTRISAAIVDHPRLIVLCAALMTLPAVDRLFDLRRLEPVFDIDPSMEALMPRGGAALEVFRQMRERFTSDDLLFVVWTGEDLFSPERLGGLKRLTRRIERLPGIAGVESLASALQVRAYDTFTEINPFLKNLPTDQAGADVLREEAVANPLFRGRLVSADGRGALVAVRFEPGLDTPALVDLVDRISAASRDEARGTRQFLSGPMFVRLEIGRILLRDLYRVMPIAVLGTLLVAALGFRTLRGICVPLLANTIAVIATLACFDLAGHALNFVTVILPPVVYVVGFAYAIHIVSDFDRNYIGDADRRQAAHSALRDVFMPLTLTAFTTAAGFASLTLSDIESIRLFGSYVALGVFFAWLSALAVAPALLVIIPANRPEAASPERGAASARRLARLDLRFRRPLLLAGAVLAVASVAGAARMEVSTEVLRNFSEDSSIQRQFKEIGRLFGGAVPLRILVESDTTDAFKQPANLHAIATLDDWLQAQPEIGGVYSLVDYVELLHRALDPESARAHPIPPTPGKTSHVLLLGGSDDFRQFTDARFSSTLLHLGANTVATKDLVGLVDRIDGRLRELPEALRGQVTGTSYLIAKTVDDITRGQVASLAGATGVIYAVLALLFGSLRIGLLALVPNVLPILVYFGILGLSPATLNLTTALVASAVLGIAVDDSIHLMTRYSREARRTGSAARGIEEALAAVVRPVTLTTASLCVGFLAVTAGELQSQVEFGLLAAVTLLVAWMLDLTFTPALCGRLQFFTLWDMLSVDLGTQPRRTLPLLAGLDARESRIAALTGRIETYRENAPVWPRPDPEPGLGLLLDGELIDPGLPGATHAGLGRGALIGVQAHAQGLHAAALEARSESRVLWLSDDRLERLRENYPDIADRIAANRDDALDRRGP